MALWSCGSKSDASEEKKDEEGKKSESPVVNANSGSGPNIAYVNLDSISENFEGYIQLKMDLSYVEVQMGEELKKIENSANSLARTIENKQQSGMYAKSEMDKLMESYQRKQMEYQQKQQQIQMETQQLVLPVQRRIESLLRKVLSEYSDEKGLDFILAEGVAAVYARPKYNVTSDVLEILNAAYEGGKDSLSLPNNTIPEGN